MVLRYLAIDWSGALSAQKQKIWLAEASGEQLLRLESDRTREQVAEHLIAEIKSTTELIIGIDFAFSMPEWFLVNCRVSSALELWSLVEDKSETWLKDCPIPFWGKPGTKRPDLLEQFRETEMSLPGVGSTGPKSVFQINGPGSVGTGSLRGMPILRRLHHAGFSIWPFDPIGWPLVIEIYPRILTGPVVKKSREARAHYLSTKYPQLDDVHRALAESSEDAFDAAVSALVMAANAHELDSLPLVGNPRHQVEGLIWFPKMGERAVESDHVI